MNANRIVESSELYYLTEIEIVFLNKKTTRSMNYIFINRKPSFYHIIQCGFKIIANYYSYYSRNYTYKNSR